jgi:hypothetical protein
VARAAPLLQPLKHTKTPNDNPAAASTSGKPGNFLSRLRTGLMPAIGSNSNLKVLVIARPATAMWFSNSSALLLPNP